MYRNIGWRKYARMYLGANSMVAYKWRNIIVCSTRAAACVNESLEGCLAPAMSLKRAVCVACEAIAKRSTTAARLGMSTAAKAVAEKAYDQ